MEDIISKSLKQAQDVLQAFVSNPDTVSRMRQAVDMLAAALENGNKILSCGNGGSLCDAAHFAEELTGRFRRDRRPLPAMAINDAAYMTCVGNDFSFDQIFARWVEARTSGRRARNQYERQLGQCRDGRREGARGRHEGAGADPRGDQ